MVEKKRAEVCPLLEFRRLPLEFRRLNLDFQYLEE